MAEQEIGITLFTKDIENIDYNANEGSIRFHTDLNDIVNRMSKKLSFTAISDSSIENSFILTVECGTINTFKLTKMEEEIAIHISPGHIDKINIRYSGNYLKINNPSMVIVEEKKALPWRYEKIPKIFFTYWYGPLSYLNYLTVKSFKYHNPDWKIIIYVPKYPHGLDPTWNTGENSIPYSGKDYLPELMLLGVSKIPIDFVDIGFKNDANEVIKSDYLRLWMLSTQGGLWSDMDIYYIRGMEKFNLEGFVDGDPKDVDTVISYNEDNIFSIGFMASAPNNPLFGYLQGKAVKSYTGGGYQDLGSALFEKSFCNIEGVKIRFPKLKIANFSSDFVYPFKWYETHLLFIRNMAIDFESSEPLENEKDWKHPRNYFIPSVGSHANRFIGLHWFAGHGNARKFVNQGNYDIPITINNIIKKYPC